MKVGSLVAVLALGHALAPNGFAAKAQKWEDVPEAVRATILANGGVVGNPVDKETLGHNVNGKTLYEAPVKDKNGNVSDLNITEDGKLVQIKTDDAADRAAELAAAAAGTVKVKEGKNAKPDLAKPAPVSEADARGPGGAHGSTGTPTTAEVASWVADYKAAHPGRGGKDWDINRKSAAEIAADPKLKRLLGLCGPDQRPVIPALAWEYGGKDHQWINPDASALVYCVYIPVSPNSEHWKYDKATDHVTADVYVKFLDQNPGKNETGAAQVMSCLGHRSNIEILVDTASLNDGKAAGLNLAEATTDLYLILPDGSRVLMYQGK